MLLIKSAIFGKIDKTDWKLNNYRFLTTNPFIDFYRFPIQSTNFIDCYRMLSIINFIKCPSWVSKHSVSLLQILYKFCVQHSAKDPFPEIPTLLFWPETSRFQRSFLVSCFRSISYHFCNFPLAKEDNVVFPASLVFYAWSFVVILWYLGLLLLLGHPSMSLRFLGVVMHWIALTLCEACVCSWFCMVFDVGYRRQFSNEYDLKMQ